MDRYDPYTDSFLHDTQYNILSTNLASLGTDCISRQQAIDIAKDLTITVEGYEMHNQAVMNYCADIMQLPPIQPTDNLQKLADEIASFKRCVKSENSDYLTGYLCALSVVEGMIADMRGE